MTSTTLRKRSGTVGVEASMGDPTPTVSADRTQTSAAKTSTSRLTTEQKIDLILEITLQQRLGGWIADESRVEGPTPGEAKVEGSTPEGPTPGETRVEPTAKQFSEDDSLRSQDNDTESMRSAKQKERKRRRKKDRHWYLLWGTIINIIAVLLYFPPIILSFVKWDFSLERKILMACLLGIFALLGVVNLSFMVFIRSNDFIGYCYHFAVVILFASLAINGTIVMAGYDS
ncbi:hypothetical protein NCAS_0A07120 [Naumovozyma castellii]|uniref:Uncharacterized protein n=1 Tax=Naumovozyma castellii TaxID=27288 RepID=G0V722_NAUCA|nr:hypothetical protein NCAS_0A07120 [Naumovozyma castellii CBS 4309]CCC67270.1 hypothetical protein NCAS_0A07120 [Naumovozyma castellii CBS 4309]